MNIALVDFMAENERLDPIKSRRWLRLMRFVASRPQEAEITRRLTEAMYRTLRSVSKQIPLGTLLKAAAEDDTGLTRRVADCGHEFAELVLAIAAEPAHDPPSTTCERYVEAVLDRYLDQMGLKLVEERAFPTFESYFDQVARWKAQVEPEMKQLASRLERGETLRVPPQPHATRTAEREELLGLSLLTGRVRGNRHVSRNDVQNRPL